MSFRIIQTVAQCCNRGYYGGKHSFTLEYNKMYIIFQDKFITDKF